MDESWWDRTAAWWAKAERALTHIRDVGALAAAFEQAGAYEIRQAVTGPGMVTATFHVLRPTPVQLLTTIGDALHNLRSSLDCFASELARCHLGDVMTAGQQRAVQFPLSLDRAAFNEFFDRRDRRGLFGGRELAALRCVQLFALRENNLDKHRRLPLLAWFLEIVYITSDTNECRWIRAHPGRTVLRDGDTIGEAAYSSDRPRPAVTAHVHLTLADDLGYAQDLVSSPESWHGYLTGWALPRMFAVADGNRPPMMIVKPRTRLTGFAGSDQAPTKPGIFTTSASGAHALLERDGHRNSMW